MLNLIIVASNVLVISMRIGDAMVKISAMMLMYYWITNNSQLNLQIIIIIIIIYNWYNHNHNLLLHCGVAHALWSNIFSWLGLSWVMPSSILDLCACWCSFGRTKSAMVWKMVPICIFWSIWRERNNRCFEDLECSMEEILAYLLYSLYSWTMAYLSPLSVSYVDFLSCFSFSS